MAAPAASPYSSRTAATKSSCHDRAASASLRSTSGTSTSAVIVSPFRGRTTKWSRASIDSLTLAVYSMVSPPSSRLRIAEIRSRTWVL